MSSVFYFILAHIKNCGLCNQLNNLVATICHYKDSKPIIVIDYFLKQINTDNFAPISEIINIPKMNNFLKKYNVVLLDKQYLNNLQLVSVAFGIDKNMLDVTDISKKFVTKNGIFISKNINLINEFGDPVPNVKKKLEIQFKINNNEQIYSLTFNEDTFFLVNDINIDLDKTNISLHPPLWGLLETTHKDMACDIFKNLLFQDNLIEKSNVFIDSIHIQKDEKINLMHLRTEIDAIDHWSKQNIMDIHTFKIKLDSLYISLIETYFNKNTKIIILTSDFISPVIDYLKNNNYNFYICQNNDLQNREENAIVDLLNSKYCNNIFIGVGGSTFSSTIDKIITTKKYFFDINNINNPIISN